MPDTLTPNIDLHKGTYQIGAAPVSTKQKAKDRAVTLRTKAMESSRQKVKSYSPGVDPSTQAKIASTPADKPISFSDQE